MKIELSKGKFLIEEEGIDGIIRDLLLDRLRTKIHYPVQPEPSDKYLNEEKNPDDKFEKLNECKESSNLNRFNTGSVAITMGTIDKPDIDQIADIDKDICGYDRIRVFDSMEKRCDITVINDGPDSLYFVVNRNGIDHEEEMWSQAELMIYPGEAWKIYNVHELRIRSETQGNKYRVTEDDIISTSTIRSVT